MILSALTIFFAICTAEYQEGDVDVSQLQTHGIAFLGHWMFAHDADPPYRKSGQVQITIKLSNPSITAIDEMSVVAFDERGTIQSWNDLDIHKEEMCGHYDMSDRILYYSFAFPHRMNKISNDTFTYTLDVYEIAVSRRYWVYLTNCYLEDNGGYKLHYKLHWEQHYSTAMGDGNHGITLLTREISHDQYHQSMFTIIAFVLSVLCLLMFRYSMYIFVSKRKQTTISISSNEGGTYTEMSEEIGFRSNLKLTKIVMTFFVFILISHSLRDLLMMTFWLNLSYNGYKQFMLYVFAMVFQSVVIMLFGALFLWLFSAKKSRKLMMITFVLSGSVSIFEFCLNIYWYNNHELSEEHSLYRYDYDGYFIVYVWMMVCFGVIFAVFYGCQHPSGCKLNKEVMVVLTVILSWFFWAPIMLLIDFCNPLTNFEDITWWNFYKDFITDCVSWSSRFISIIVFLVAVHPLNRCGLKLNPKQI